MANVWVATITGERIRHDRFVALAAGKVPGKGWAVIGYLARGEPAVLAALGRGTAAKGGAQRLCNELPQAIAAAGKDGRDRTVAFVKHGYPKGEGQWSTLAAPGAGIRRIPVVPPGEPQRRRDAGSA